MAFRKHQWLASTILFFALSPTIAEAKRVALVIANSRYQAVSALPNPAADARLIAASLRRAGFDSVELQLDLSKTALEGQLRAFGQRADGADVALIYYAGHGIEAGGQNYLIPIDAVLARDRDLEVEATRLDTALAMGEGAKLRIVVLDACRNNPFVGKMARSIRSRAVGRGLAIIEPEGETLVVYSAKAGATASDGTGANSPFAESLAKRITQPGLEISLLFRAVRDDVLAKTGREQEPFTYGSLSGTAFYFVEGKATQGQPRIDVAVAQPAAPSVSRETTETLYWQGALTANTEPAFRLYLKQYPSGTFAELAKQNLGRFAAAPKVQAQSKPAVPSSSAAFVGAASSMPNLSAAFSAPTGQVSAGAGSAAAQRFFFVPSQAMRKQHTAEFFQTMRSGGNAQMANILETAFASQDTFAGLDKVIAEYGLKSNNLADTLTVFLDTLREAANGKDENVTRKQALAVRDQMALILLASPETANLSDVKKQELADALILNTLVVAAAFEAVKAGDPSVKRELADQIQAMVKTSLGIDLRAVRLTNEGYRL